MHAQILGVPGARATLLVTELYLWARLPSAILAQATRGLSKVVAPKALPPPSFGTPLLVLWSVFLLLGAFLPTLLLGLGSNPGVRVPWGSFVWIYKLLINVRCDIVIDYVAGCVYSLATLLVFGWKSWFVSSTLGLPACLCAGVHCRLCWSDSCY